MSHEVVDSPQRRAVAEARAELRRNLDVAFKSQAGTIRRLLENLPILDLRDPLLQAYPQDRIHRWAAEGAAGYLIEDRWFVDAGADAHAGPAGIAGDPDLLIVTYIMDVYGFSHTEVKVTVARIGQDEYACWRFTDDGHGGGEYDVHL